jgi:phage-related protein
MAAGPTIAAKFIADTSQMQDGVGKATSGMSESIGSFAKKAALAFGAAFAVDKVIEFGKASVEAAAADEAAQATLATTLRNVTGATDAQVSSTEDYISALSKQTAIADDDLRPAMDTLVRTFGNAEDAQKALAIATDVSAGTGKDLSAVSAALGKAAMGSTGALAKLGIETKNADGSAKSLDQIMASLSETFSGQAAVAADTTAGRMKNAGIQFGEFQESVGSLLLPILGSLAGILTDTVVPALSGLVDAVKPFVTEVAGGIQAFFAAFVDGSDDVTSSGFAGWLEGIGVTVRNLWDTITSVVVPFVAGVVEGVKEFIGAFTDAGDNVTKSGLAGFFQSLGDTARRLWDKISEGAEQVGKWFTERLVPAAQDLGKAMGPVLENISKFVTDKILPAMEKLADVAGTALGKIGETLTDTVLPALTKFATWLGENSDVMLAAFTAMAIMVAATVVPAFISWAIAAGAAAIATIAAAAPFIAIGAVIAGIAFLIIHNWDSIKAGLSVLWDWIQTIFGWIITGITTYVGIYVTIFTTAWNVILSVITTLWDWIQTVFGWIVTGIQAYVSLVITFWTSAWEGLKLVITTLWDWITTVFGWIKDGISGAMAIVTDTFTRAWDTVKSGVTAVWQWVTDKFNAISDAVHTAIDNLLSWVNWGWDQIKDGASTVWKFVTDKFQAIADFFKGLVDGIGDTAKKIADAIKAPINWVLNKWNEMEFQIPEIHIPEVDVPIIGKQGGGTVGGQRFTTNNIPLLAAGGVLTSPTLFVGGEAGTEIVAPEDMLRAIVAEEAGGTYILNLYPRTADASDVAYGFRRLELLAGLP